MRFVTDDRVVAVDNGRRLQVIAAGLPRCATSSMKAALESKWLDYYSSMHMAHIIPWPERSQMVINAMGEENKETRQKILHKLFDGYAATCDFPGVAFTDDLMDMYPDAKIILNQRQSAEVWAKSLEDSLIFFSSWTFRITTFLFRSDRLHAKMHLAAFELYERKVGEKVTLKRDTFVKWYTMYNQWVREEAKKRDRPVLEWRPQDGWEPICNFLGKPVPPPHLPFPRTNDQREIRKLRIFLVGRGLLAWAALLAAAYFAGVSIRG